MILEEDFLRLKCPIGENQLKLIVEQMNEMHWGSLEEINVGLVDIWREVINNAYKYEKPLCEIDFHKLFLKQVIDGFYYYIGIEEGLSVVGNFTNARIVFNSIKDKELIKRIIAEHEVADPKKPKEQGVIDFVMKSMVNW